MSFDIGSNIRGYTITGVISHEGGFADVFEASPPDDGPPVALKVLRPGADALCQYLFSNEARMLHELADFGHPNIVRCVHADVTGATPFIALEKLGRNLFSSIPCKPMPCDRASRYVQQACSALVPIHQRGWVHHDVHPHNMLLAADGIIKLTDFGIAYAPGEPKPDRKLGIDLFLSPEAYQGVRNDPRSDLYSLGLSYFLLLTSRTFVRHLTQPVPDPREYAGIEMPAAQVAVLSRLCEKDPRRRFATAEEALAAIAGTLT